MTYGTHQETAAAALTYLVATVAEPSTEEVPQVLRVREQLRLAVLERTEILGEGGWENPTAKASLEAMASQGIHLLHRIARESPHHHGVREQASPVEVLAGRGDASPVAGAWVEAARAVTLGNHDLRTTQDPTWTHSAGAAWYLLADTAELVEALVVLDDQLDRRGHLDPHTRPEPSWNIRGRRVITATVAREARWAATDPSPDTLSSASTLSAAGVQLVRDPETLAAAQLRLANLVKIRNRREGTYNPADDLTLAQGRSLVFAQAKLNTVLAQACQDEPGVPGAVLDRVANRTQQLLAISETSARYRDLVPRPPNRSILTQQLEISIHDPGRLLRGTAPEKLPQLVDRIDVASHIVAVEIAKSLHRQALRTPDGPFARYNDDLDKIITTATPRAPFPQACQAVIETPGPMKRWAEPVSRRALRQALQDRPNTVGARRPTRMDSAHRPPEFGR